MKHTAFARVTLFLTCLLSTGGLARGALYGDYTGNGSDGAGGVVGRGTLHLQEQGGTIAGTLTPGTSYFNDCVVLYIDSRAGGFTDNTGFTDTLDAQRRAVSGCLNRDNRSTARFATGFTADFALVLSTQYGCGLYELHNGGDESLTLLRTLSMSQVGAAYQFGINWEEIGVTGDAAHYLAFESTYITATGYRSLESYETIAGQRGFGGTVTWSNFNTFGLAPVPEPTNLALAVFGVLGLTGGVVSGIGGLRRAAVQRKTCTAAVGQPSPTDSVA